MIEVIALKLAWCLCAFLWAFISLEWGWGVIATLVLCVAALGLGASAARDLGRIGQEEA